MRRIGLSFAGPGEIESREVELDPQENPEEIKSREVELDPQENPEEIKSREVELDPQESPGRDQEEGGGAGPSREPRKRSRAGRWSWAQKVGLSFASVVPQQQCYGHCPCDSAPNSR